MPIIRKSADLRNKYGEISDFCRKHKEPVFVTRNGEGDLAVMSIEAYEELVGKRELYELIDEGIADIKNGKTVSETNFKKEMRLQMKKNV